MDPERATPPGLTSTVTFPRGTSPRKGRDQSTAIDPSVVGPTVCTAGRPQRAVFRRDACGDAAIRARSGPGPAGDVMVLICPGPLGRHEEILQHHLGAEHLSWGKAGGRLTRRFLRTCRTGACARPHRAEDRIVWMLLDLAKG